MKRIGCTGHQTLSPATRRSVTAAIAEELADLAGTDTDGVVGVTCLAEGADQIFAHTILASGGILHAVRPCADYEDSFQSSAPLTAYASLLRLAAEVSSLDFPAPSEEAYLAAGHAVVQHSDVLLAVWDGRPAAGKGGTADIVHYARARGLDVRVIWPAGASRS
ncbi:hypothetical protein ACFCXA_17380 [Streptomyces virginiae]|uniref:hypothetical protein n=1 Tax=Streptomyces virginiae TaxID=1961 RepID=UPI003254A692